MGKTVKIVLTPDQLRWLISHFKHTKNDEIKARLNISDSTLHRFARELGLKKSRQFMQKCQRATNEAARASHLRNGTYPPKGFIIPKSAENRFKKGHCNKDRMSPKRYREMQEKRRASWKKTRDADRSRFVFGFEQRTNFRFVKQSKSKVSYRYNMKKKGYIVDLKRNVFYYPSESMRCPRAESNAQKHHIRILPFSVDDG